MRFCCRMKKKTTSSAFFKGSQIQPTSIVGLAKREEVRIIYQTAGDSLNFLKGAIFLDSHTSGPHTFAQKSFKVWKLMETWQKVKWNLPPLLSEAGESGTFQNSCSFFGSVMAHTARNSSTYLVWSHSSMWRFLIHNAIQRFGLSVGCLLRYIE